MPPPRLTPDVPSPAGFATLGPVHLDVTDRERSLAFWRDALGLCVRDEHPDTITLGTARDPLLVLHPVATVPAQPAHAGLYHVALHPPHEAHFASLLARLIARRVPVRPTDHTFSKALYLWDPDGLGVEVTLETPARGTDVTVGTGGPSILDAAGRRRSLAEPLDVDEVLAHLPDGGADRPLAAGTTVGHIHLRVADVEAARRFYQQRLGFLEHFGIPGLVSNLHTGGTFPHRLAVNAFDGRGLVQPPAGMARLRRFTNRFETPERLATALAGVPEGVEVSDGRLVHDPSGNALVLTHGPRDA